MVYSKCQGSLTIREAQPAKEINALRVKRKKAREENMTKRQISEQIFDCWHIAQFIASNGIAAGLTIEQSKTTSEGILQTWYQAHSWKEQLQEASDKLHRRNLQIKELKKQLNPGFYGNQKSCPICQREWKRRIEVYCNHKD
jgi:hypothetical protein